MKTSADDERTIDKEEVLIGYINEDEDEAELQEDSSLSLHDRIQLVEEVWRTEYSIEGISHKAANTVALGDESSTNEETSFLGSTLTGFPDGDTEKQFLIENLIFKKASNSEITPLDRRFINSSSKIGGRPIWMLPHSLPNDLMCRSCGNLLVFLLQIYAPKPVNSAFHRMLYVFVCWTCGQDCRLYRCQLKRDSAFYPPYIDDLEKFEPRFAYQEYQIRKTTCSICGLPEELESKHKRCLSAKKGFTRSCFKERRLYIELEEDSFKDTHAEEVIRVPLLLFCPWRVFHFLNQILVMKLQDVEARLVRHVQSGVKVEEVPEGAEEPEDDEHEKDLDQDPLNNHEEDLVLDSYIGYMNNLLPHVLRYGGLDPVWFCKKGILERSKVPPCECGAPRIYEFQIHSTILDYLGVLDNLELSFGILCCYTCSQHCDAAEGSYFPEFIYKQRDPTMDNPVWRQL